MCYGFLDALSFLNLWFILLKKSQKKKDLHYFEGLKVS